MTQKFCHFNSLSPSIESSNTTQTPHFFGGGFEKSPSEPQKPGKDTVYFSPSMNLQEKMMKFGEISKPKSHPFLEHPKKKKTLKVLDRPKKCRLWFQRTKKQACRFLGRQGPWVFTHIFWDPAEKRYHLWRLLLPRTFLIPYSSWRSPAYNLWARITWKHHHHNSPGPKKGPRYRRIPELIS